MVVMQLLFDSLSRCFGIPLDPNDQQGPNGLGAQPLGASNSRNQSKEQDKSSHNSRSYDNQHHRHHHPDHHRDHDSLKLHDPEWDNLFETVSQHQRSSACCYSAAANPLEDDQVPDAELEQETLDRAQQQAFGGKHIRSSSSSSHKDVLRKARRESTKRKLNIFRNENEHKRTASSSSFASRLLGSETGFQTGAILCFANPIFDSEDDDVRLYRDDRDGEDTINSTLYFDAKYEHMVENRPPMPLYPEQALRLSETHNDEIVKIYKSGALKHKIKSIYCPSGSSLRSRSNSNGGASSSGAPPSSRHGARPGPRSMADSSSDVDDYDSISVHSRHRHTAQNYSSNNRGCSPSQQSTSPIPPPLVTKSRQELNVISDWVFSSTGKSSEQLNHDQQQKQIQQLQQQQQEQKQDQMETIPPSLKLMNNSSLSTQALTPTPSASDTQLSPKKERCEFDFGHNVVGQVIGEI